MLVIVTIAVYFVALFALSRWTTRKQATNETFYRADRRSPWRMVAFGMVGASISGVTFVSVPGMVLTSGMTYLQLCLGFIIGYVVVAFVLLPVYYKLNLVSIYAYLGQRLGRRSYLAGASFFMLSKMIGTAVKFYVACLIVQQFVMDRVGVPFAVTTIVMVLLIWLYTHRGGVRTLVFTDSLQTLCLFTSLLIIIYIVMSQLQLSLPDALSAIAADDRSRVFVFDDFVSRQNFWKQLLSGAFIVVVMTGLDQDMMQKNLTCRTLREAQKNMCSYGVAFVPANLLFLALGVLLAQLFEAQGVALPAHGDEMLPMFVAAGMEGASPLMPHLSPVIAYVLPVVFTLGIIAASFSSADSALTALTTSYCVDIRQRPDDIKMRRRSHLLLCLLFVACVLLIRAVNSSSLIDAIYTIVSYTYGPLLGLFAFGLFTKRRVYDCFVPAVCIAAPSLCYVADVVCRSVFNYSFGYELLMLNGLLTFAGLCVLSRSASDSGEHNI